VPDIQPREFTIEFKTNNLWAQNTYSLVDEYDNLVGQSNFSAANTAYNDNYNLSGCYRLIVEDSGNDGLQWFANAAQGAGYVRLKDTSGNVIKVFNPDFGRRFEYSFTTAKRINTTTIEDFNFSETFNVYPNPAHGKLMIEGTHIQGSSVTINNVLGQKVAAPMSQNKSVLEFDTSNLTPGVYFVTIKKEGKVATKKIIVQ
jgi:hypothetical protein